MRNTIRLLGVVVIPAAMMLGGTLGCRTHTQTRTITYEYTEEPSPRAHRHHHPDAEEKVIDETEWEMESPGTMVVDP